MAERQFPAVVIGDHDGDTVVLMCDMGFDDWHLTKLRIMLNPKMGIAARELRMPGGPEAAQFMASLLPSPSFPPKPTCFVYSYRWDKYAPRVDGDIQLFGGRRISELMIESGYAVPWDGNGKQPLPPWPIPPAGLDKTGRLFVP